MLNFFGNMWFKFDPALGDPLAKMLLNEAQIGNIDATLTQIESFRIDKWDQRAFYVELIGQHLKNSETFPDSPSGNLLKGCHAIHRAWNARGAGRASTVTQQGWTSFSELLHTAQDTLLRSAEQDANDPTPFALLQKVAKGLQLEQGVAEAWLQEALSRDPLNQQAHYQHLFFLCKKWRGGSHENMYTFARSTLGKLPPNSTLGSILYLAFQEHYLYLMAFDKDTSGAKMLIEDSTIQQESIDVYERFLANRLHIERVSDYWPHNAALCWFFMTRMSEYVRQESAKTGRYFTEYPWSTFYRLPSMAYQTARIFG